MSTFARLSVVLLALLGAPHRADADLLARALATGDESGGAPPGAQQPPPQADDLTAWAGPIRPITLPDLLQQAVRNTPSLATARVDIQIAEARILQTQSRDDWQLAAQITANSSQSYFSGIQFDRTTNIGFGASIAKPLSTGGIVTFGARTDFQRTPSFDISDPSNAGRLVNNWANQVTATISQPLLRGRGRMLYDAAERRATLSRDAAVLGRRLAAIQAIQGVVASYWDLVLAERQVAITRSSLELAKERLRITQIGNEGGKVPRSEIPAVQQIIATREEDVLNGELAVLDRSISLRRAAGMPIGKGELGLRLGAPLTPQDVAWDLGELTERAYTASPELAQLATQDATAKILIDVTENGLLPQLDAAFTIGPVGQDARLGTSWSNVITFKSLQFGGSLTFQHTLGQENLKGLAREQREQRRQLEVNAVDIKAQLALGMSRAVAQAELARRRVALSQRAIELANENIKIETDRFNLGKSTNFDVLNRQEELRQAELRRAQAMIDWHKAETVVLALTGDILPTYGVTLD